MFKLLRFLKPHKKFAIFTLALAAINNILTLAFPLLMSQLINNGITKGDFSNIKSVGFTLFWVCIAAAVVSVGNCYCSSKVSTGFAGELRSAVFKKVEQFSQGDIDKIGVPSLITRTTNDIRQIQDLVLMSLRSIITVPIMLIGGTIMAVIMDPGLSLTLLIIVPVIALIAGILAKTVIPYFKRIQKKVDSLNLIIREKISGIRIIRAFNRTEKEDERFKKANNELTGIQLRVSRIFASLIPIVTLLVFLLIILLMVFGYNQVDKLTDPVAIQNTIGDLQAFIIYLVFIVVAVSTAAAMFVMIPRAKTSANRINEVLELEPEMSVEKAENTAETTNTIEFKNVDFDYKTAEGEQKKVLRDVSFTVKPGKTTAIIGSTGSGKSTILNLIPRFYDVTGGEILIDGVNIKNLDFNTIYEKLGYIPQQSFLFSGTVADNLRYGKDNATDDELWKALEIAQAKDFVEKLPDKLESMISQNGTNLSGGQKQRLCIARAIVKNAKFYLFDDSFSALDFITDARLRSKLREELTDSAILIVAQRVGTIINADEIIVLENGMVAGRGTHEELLKTCKVYNEIAVSQLSSEEVESL